MGAGHGWNTDVVSDYRHKDATESKEVEHLSFLLESSAKTEHTRLRKSRRSTVTKKVATTIGVGRTLVSHHSNAATDMVEFLPILPLQSKITLGGSVDVGVRARIKLDAAARGGVNGTTTIRITIAGIANAYNDVRHGAAEGESSESADGLTVTEAVTLRAGASEWVDTIFPISLKDYLPYLEESNHFQFTITATVDGSPQIFFYPDIAVNFAPTKLQVSAWHIQKTVLAKHAVVARVQWANPIKMDLTECSLYAAVSGSDRAQELRIGDLAPLEELSAPFAFDIDACEHEGDAESSESCDRVVASALVCKELMDMHGYTELNVGGSGGILHPDEASDLLLGAAKGQQQQHAVKIGEIKIGESETAASAGSEGEGRQDRDVGEQLGGAAGSETGSMGASSSSGSGSSTFRGTGQEMCEGHGYGKDECAKVGCCQFAEFPAGGGECHSNVGNSACVKRTTTGPTTTGDCKDDDAQAIVLAKQLLDMTVSGCKDKDLKAYCSEIPAAQNPCHVTCGFCVPKIPDGGTCDLDKVRARE